MLKKDLGLLLRSGNPSFGDSSGTQGLIGSGGSLAGDSQTRILK